MLVARLKHLDDGRAIRFVMASHHDLVQGCPKRSTLKVLSGRVPIRWRLRRRGGIPQASHSQVKHGNHDQGGSTSHRRGRMPDLASDGKPAIKQAT